MTSEGLPDQESQRTQRAGDSGRRLSTRNATLLRETVQIVLAAMALASSASQLVKFQAAKVWR